MRHRAWGLLLVVPAAMFALVVWRAPFHAFHPHLVVAGTPSRFVATIVRAGRADARGAIWLDNVFVLSWLLVVPRLLRVGLQRWCPDRRRRFGAWPLAPRFAVTAAFLDLVENAIALSMVGRQTPATLMTLLLSLAGWSKWLFYAGALVGLAGLVLGPLLAPVVRPSMRKLFGVFDGGERRDPALAAAPAGDSEVVSGERIGICVSGDGIRAASVALGALRQLDRPDGDRPSLFRRARWLSGVSGAAWLAGGWRIGRRPGAQLLPLPTELHDGLFDADHPWAQTVVARRRSGDDGNRSVASSVGSVLIRTVAVLGALLSAVYLIGWLGGHAVRTRAVHSWFPFGSSTFERRLDLGDLFPLRIVVPGGAWVLAGALVVAAATTRPDAERRARARRLGFPAITIGALFLLVAVALPAALIEAPAVLRRVPFADGADEGAGVLGLLSSLGALGALLGAAVSHRTRTWLRLGSVLLVLALVLFGGKVAHTVAHQRGGSWSSWVAAPGFRLPVAVVAVVWLVVLNCVAAHRLTLHGLHRKRVGATFALGDGNRAPLPPLDESAEPSWAAYARAHGPELIVAATADASPTTPSGAQAVGVTFRPDRVTLLDRTGGTSASVSTAAYPRGSWWDGFPGDWPVSKSLALAAGPFGARRRRAASGTTPPLLVALNLRLGAWVPNPRFVEWFADPCSSPRVHIGYLVKELFGRYDPTRDAFVHVADTGHREHLALVELLRERPDVVCWIDAGGGDRPGSFETVQEAIETAAAELDVDIQLDLDRLRADAGVLPDASVAEGTIVYPPTMGGGTGRILYGRAELTEPASEQRLTDEEHLQLVALGEHVGARIGSLFAGVSA